jgi:hypothetical protein
MARLAAGLEASGVWLSVSFKVWVDENLANDRFGGTLAEPKFTRHKPTSWHFGFKLMPVFALLILAASPGTKIDVEAQVAAQAGPARPFK